MILNITFLNRYPKTIAAKIALRLKEFCKPKHMFVGLNTVLRELGSLISGVIAKVEFQQDVRNKNPTKRGKGGQFSVVKF